MGLQEAAGGTDLEGPDVGVIDEEMGTEAMQAEAGPGRSQVPRAAARHGSPRGAGNTPLPPQEPVAVTEEPFTSQLLGNTVGGRHTQPGAGHFMGFQDPGSLRKGKTKFPAFQAQKRK